MIISQRKKDLEIGTFEKEIHEELERVYKSEKFYKYANEENFEKFAYEGKEDITDYTIFYDSITTQSKDRKNNSGVIYNSINSIRSFKNFIGKEIPIQKEPHYNIIPANVKIKLISVKRHGSYAHGTYCTYCALSTYRTNCTYCIHCNSYNCGKGIVARIDEIRNTLSCIKNSLHAKKKLKKKKENAHTMVDIDSINLLSNLDRVRNKLGKIIKFVEVSDENFCDNMRYYKYIYNCFTKSGEMNIFDIIRMMKKNEKSTELLTNKMIVINYNNVLSLRKTNMYKNFKDIVYKADMYESLFYKKCFNKNENVASILLSFFLFLNLCLNENMYKRILNYIYLLNFELKKCVEYLESRKKDIRTLHILFTYVKSLTLGINYNDISLFIENIFRINLNENNEKLLKIYKKLLNNEISVSIISKEANKINSTIQMMNHNLGKSAKVIKSVLHGTTYKL
ncbi:conserved Plasmodium protein, unknown function [Plasmodium malariae]|uniref:Uncharacterized protein n=1 Tax=Plasmodium malariae TaxID=5858 RepID=A0A1C3KYE3_PLAMA|nr:conserved Plasmodium protein, unknown function [Plasmodium malariae]